MKKVWLKVLAGGLSLASILALTACGGNDGPNPGPVPHEHTFNGYQSDADSHWQVCVDGDKETAKTAHDFTDEYDTDCSVCGYVRTVKSKKEKTMEYIESLKEIEVAEINTFATSYDDMVKYLADKGLIKDASNPVDVSTTGGWLKKYDGTYEEARQIADKEFDYNGVCVLWWDIQNKSEYMDYWASMASNGGTIVVAGGMYSFSTVASSGCYAIALKTTIEATINNPIDYDNYEESKAVQDKAIEEAKAEYADGLKAFGEIDKTANSIDCFMKTDELAVLLQKAGFLAVTDLAEPTDLNKQYYYVAEGRDWVGYDKSETGWSDYYEKNFYVDVATEAKQYGNISIYYYNTTDGMFDYSSEGATWSSLQECKVGTVYADMDGDWEFTAFTQKDKKYDENGEVATFTVDMIIGNFAISITE